MAIYTGAYVGARSCTSGPQPGAWGAMDYFLSAHAKDGGVNTGIYNCRSVRGGSTTSLHGEGRAADFGIRPYSASWGWALAKALVAFSKELGIQCVIFDRKIWSSSYPHSGFRRYNGSHSHTDHIHCEFTWARANTGRSETAKHFAKVLGGVKPEDIKVGGGGSSSGSSWKTVKGSTPLVKKGHKGEPVRRIQGAVGTKVDGFYGNDTVSAVKKYQKSKGLSADGIVGGKTWAAINNKSKPKPKPKGKAAPKPTYSFPLPSSYYFGPKSGGNKSVSGFHKRSFKGAQDRTWLKRFANQLSKRGWSVGKGKSYLKRSGNDGLYGSEYRSLIRAFQKDQGLSQDGLLGKKTWDAAFRNRIS